MLGTRWIACCLASMAGCATARDDAPNDLTTTIDDGSSSSVETSSSTTASESSSGGESSDASEGSSEGSTGSNPSGCGLPDAVDLSAAFPVEAQWLVDEGSIGAATTFPDDEASLAIWLNEGFGPFVDGFTAGAIDLGDVELRPGAGLSVSETIGDDTYRVYLATSGTLVLDAFEALADGSTVTGRWEGVLMQEIEAATQTVVDGGCSIELTDATFELTIDAIEGGDTDGPG